MSARKLSAFLMALCEKSFARKLAVERAVASATSAAAAASLARR